MREILFRGKAIHRNKGYHRTKYKNGDWVYGLITRLYDERFENLPAEMTNTSGISSIEIDYKTIGQYTGLTDKNGKKIFEGDVVCFDGKYGKIVFRPHFGEYELETDSEYFPICYHDEFEVRGNIHDDGYYFLEGGESNGPV